MALEGKQFSRYRILRLIGKGGMGEVYLAEDVQVARQVAAKFIRIEDVQVHQETASNALRLFWREATTIARLDHAHILPLYDHGETMLDGSQMAYLIIPYRPEGSLISWLRQRSQNQPGWHLTPQQIIHIIQQAGAAVQYAHDRQVMHLDVKPANFLIRSHSLADNYPDLLLSDFGIARLSSATSSSSQNVRGTPTYMAPEQCNNRPEFASDQYALGIMAYELLTGNPPFQGAPLSVMFAHLQEQPRSVRDLLPQLPPAIDLVLQRALAKKPEERFPSVAAFAEACQAALQGASDAVTVRGQRPAFEMPAPMSLPDELPANGDIRATLTISPQEARQGTTRVLNLPHGQKVNVRVPAGSQSEQIIVLMGEGEKPAPGASAGNLYLTLSVQSGPADSSPALKQATPVRVMPPIQEPITPPLRDIFGSSPETPFYREATVEINEQAPLSSIPQNDLPYQNLATLPPVPTFRPSRRVFSPLVLVLLVLVMLGSGTLSIYGAVTGNWPWMLAGHTTWQSQSSGTSQALITAIWANSRYVVIGNQGTILTSPDAHTWTTQNAGTSQDLWSIAWSGSLFVVVGLNGIILTSPDAHTWTAQTSGTTQSLWSVVWSGSLFVIAGTNGTILTSPDGIVWTAQNAGTSELLDGASWSGSLFVVIGDNGTILTSPNGILWTPQSSGTTKLLEYVVWLNSQFILVGDTGTIFTSPDAHTWTARNSGTKQTLFGISHSDSQYVITGDKGLILTSPDGQTWNPQNSGTTQRLWSIVHSPSLTLIVGDQGTILTSH